MEQRAVNGVPEFKVTFVSDQPPASDPESALSQVRFFPRAAARSAGHLVSLIEIRSRPFGAGRSSCATVAPPPVAVV